MKKLLRNKNKEHLNAENAKLRAELARHKKELEHLKALLTSNSKVSNKYNPLLKNVHQLLNSSKLDYVKSLVSEGKMVHEYRIISIIDGSLPGHCPPTSPVIAHC